MAVTEVGPRAASESAAAPWTETTRLLCAAAYTEPTFAQEVVEDLLEEDLRAVEVPPAVDPASVIRHCLVAAGHKQRRDRTLAVLLALFMLYAVIIGGVEALGSALVFGGLAYLVARGPWRATKPRRLMRWLLAAYLLLALAALLISGLIWPGNSVTALGVILAWATIARDLWRGSDIATKTLNRRAFDPDAAPAAADPEIVRRIEEIVERQVGNLTVYSGFLPFSSAGVDLGGWSFVIDLRKGREEMGHRVEPTPVAPLELYRAVEAALRELHMSKLTIEDRAYVNGTDVRDDADLLPAPTARPSTSVSAAQLQRLMVVPTHRVRHYTCVRVTDWGGELVLSQYLRFGVANGRLFCELSRFLLLPLNAEMHRSDGLPAQPELEDMLSVAWRSLVLTPVLLFRSPYAVLLRPWLRARRRARQRSNAEHDFFFDYGAAETVLDRVRAQDCTRYFQVLDKEMYAKVLERAILDAVVGVLEAHDIDPGELVERRSMLVNNGLMVHGSVKAENVAVGMGAGIYSQPAGGSTAPPAGGGSA